MISGECSLTSMPLRTFPDVFSGKKFTALFPMQKFFFVEIIDSDVILLKRSRNGCATFNLFKSNFKIDCIKNTKFLFVLMICIFY